MSRLCIGIVFFAVSMANGILLRFVINKYLFDFPLFLLSVQYGLTLFALELARYGYTLDNYRERCWGHSTWFILFPIHWNRVEHWHRSLVMIAMSQWLNTNAKEGRRVFPCSRLLNVFWRRYSLLFFFFSFYRKDQKEKGSSLSRTQFCAIALLCLGAGLTNVFDWIWDRYSMGYGLISALGQSLSLVLLEHFALFSTPLQLVYDNSFNCLFLFLLVDLVMVSPFVIFPMFSCSGWVERSHALHSLQFHHSISSLPDRPTRQRSPFQHRPCFSPRPLTVPCRRRSSTTFDQPFKWVLFEQCLYS